MIGILFGGTVVELFDQGANVVYGADADVEVANISADIASCSEVDFS